MNARWFNLLRFALLTLTIGATLTLFVFGDFAARRYLYPARRTLTPADSPAVFGSHYRPLCLRTADGVTLAAWYAPPKNAVAILLAAFRTFPTEYEQRVITFFNQTFFSTEIP